MVFGLLSTLGFVVFLVWIFICGTRKKKMRTPIIGIIISMVVFLISVTIPNSEDTESIIKGGNNSTETSSSNIDSKDASGNDALTKTEEELQKQKAEEEEKAKEAEQRKRVEELNNKKQIALSKVKAVTQPTDKITQLEENLKKDGKEFFVFKRVTEEGFEGDTRFCVEVNTLDLYVYFSNDTILTYDEYIKKYQR